MLYNILQGDSIFLFFKQVVAPEARGTSRARDGATATAEATPCSYAVSPKESPIFLLCNTHSTVDRGECDWDGILLLYTLSSTL